MTTTYGTRHHGCRIDEFRWRGHRLVVLENELLRIGILPSKGADIVEFRYKPNDLDFLWHAPQGILPAGEPIPTIARAQGSFLDYYPGGWQEILPNAGPATFYKGAELGQHGEAALLPWDVRVIEDQASGICVEFSVEMRRTPFRLVRRMLLETGSPSLILRESLTNMGEQEIHYAWGHHPAFGAPVLEPGCVIELPDCDVIQPDHAESLQRRFAVGQSGRFPYLKAVNGEQARVDQVQAKDSRTEDILVFSGFPEGRCRLKNSRTGLAFELLWDKDVFPFLWCWQVYGGSWDYPYYGRAYTVALEPFNCPSMDLAAAVHAGLAHRMLPGATRKTDLEVRIVDSARA
jgi:hypothetical protein